MNKRIFELLAVSFLLLGACNSSGKKRHKTSSEDNSSVTSETSSLPISSESSIVSGSNLSSVSPTSQSTPSQPTSQSSASHSTSQSSSSESSTTSTPVGPDEYYSNIKDSDSGTNLKDKLTVIVNTGVTKVPYGNHEGESAYAMRICDRNWELSPDENDTNPYMNLLYMVDNTTKPHRWSELEDTWNKEHIWAKSNGFKSEGSNAHADLHHLRASDYKNNNRRGNFCFNDLSSVSGTEGIKDANEDVSGYLLKNTSYMPLERDRGDVARALFYMATRYAKSSYGAEYNLYLSFENSNNNSGGWWGHLDVLLKWHEDDPVDDFERNRNNLIYERFQHNRNPFIDHPEYARRIWSN